MKREFKKVYNPITGKTELQHWSGGVFVKNLNEVNKKIAIGGSYGKGYKRGVTVQATVTHEPNKELNDAIDQGKMIIDGLRSRGGFGMKKQTTDLSDIQARIKKLMVGSGLQVN